MILLSLQGVQKSFGTNEVLRDASLTLQDGERMGLVGVNFDTLERQKRDSYYYYQKIIQHNMVD